MSPNEIIAMAREANPEHDVTAMLPFLSRFAALVAALAAAKEREACAHVCESEWSDVAERMYGRECAAFIRARSKP